MLSYRNEYTNNPERKWNKKLRNATTPEQQTKAEDMLKCLQRKKQKKKCELPMNEDQVFAEAREWNRSSEAKHRVNVTEKKRLYLIKQQVTRAHVNETRNKKTKRLKKNHDIPERVSNQVSIYKTDN